MKEMLGIIAVIFTIIGYIPYIVDTTRGKTKPHIYSWFIWSLVTFIIFAIQLFGKGGYGSYATFITGLLCLIIFTIGFRSGKKYITRFDSFVFISAIIAIGLWVFVKLPFYSNLLIVSINLLANLLTLRKTWVDPYSETLFTWQMGAVRTLFALGALGSYSFLTLFYPITNLLVNVVVSGAIMVRRRMKKGIQSSVSQGRD